MSASIQDVKDAVTIPMFLESIGVQVLPAGKEKKFSAFYRVDKNPSGTIFEDGRAWFDHPEDKGGDVLDLAMLKYPGSRADVLKILADRFNVKPSTSERSHSRASKTSTSSNGAGKVTRYEVLPGVFHVRIDLPDGKKKVYWENLNGGKVETIPPWLHNHIDDDGVVCVHEGEKSAEAGRALGLRNSVGTFGTGATPTPEALAFCKGRDVVLIADAHEVGRIHMRKVAANLRGIARSVKLTEFPGVPEGGDADDFLKMQGADAGRLAADLVESAVDVEVVVDADIKGSACGFTLVKDLLSEPVEDIQWLVEGLLPLRGFSLLASAPKVGKTTLVFDLVVSVAQGRTFLGRATIRGAVFLCSFEEIRGRVAASLRRMGATNEDIHVFTGLPSPDFMAQLVRDVAKFKPALIVFDTLFRLVKTKDGNDYNAVTAALEPVLSLARASDVHVMALHHSPKSPESTDGVLGSTAIFGSVDTLIRLKKAELGERSLSTVQRYGEDIPESMLVLDKATGRMSLAGDMGIVTVTRITDKILKVLAVSQGPINRDEVIKRVGGRKKETTDSLRLMIQSGTVVQVGKGVKGQPAMFGLPDSYSRPTQGAGGNWNSEPPSEDPETDESEFDSRPDLGAGVNRNPETPSEDSKTEVSGFDSRPTPTPGANANPNPAPELRTRSEHESAIDEVIYG